MKPMLLALSVFAVGCGGRAFAPHEWDGPLPPPFTAKKVCDATDDWWVSANVEDDRDCACVSGNLNRAATMLYQNADAFPPPGVDGRWPDLVAVFGTTEFWVSASEFPEWPDGAERDPEWADFSSYAGGRVQTDRRMLGLMHALIHRVDTQVYRRTVAESMEHEAWVEKGWASLASDWRHQLFTYPCLAAP